MWRRTYLALVLLRLFFALSPSYLHPDEHFQGPEAIAGLQRHDEELDIESDMYRCCLRL